MRSSDVEKVPQPSPEMTGYRRVMDHFGLRRGSGSDSKLTSIAASPAAVSQSMILMYIHCIHACNFMFCILILSLDYMIVYMHVRINLGLHLMCFNCCPGTSSSLQ